MTSYRTEKERTRIIFGTWHKLETSKLMQYSWCGQGQGNLRKGFQGNPGMSEPSSIHLYQGVLPVPLSRIAHRGRLHWRISENGPPTLRSTCHATTKLNTSPTISLQTILGTKEGIRALIKFLTKTGTFSRMGTTKHPSRPPIIWRRTWGEFQRIHIVSTPAATKNRSHNLPKFSQSHVSPLSIGQKSHITHLFFLTQFRLEKSRPAAAKPIEFSYSKDPRPEAWGSWSQIQKKGKGFHSQNTTIHIDLTKWTC